MIAQSWPLRGLLYGLLLCGVTALPPHMAIAQESDLTPRQRQLLESIRWQNGPDVGQLGAVATVKVPAAHQFTDGDGARAINEVVGEPPDPQTLGMLLPEEGDWTIVFSYEDIGYVKEDEQDDLDADAILESIKAGTEEGNKYRVRMGGTPLEVIGWEQKPKYNAQTHRLVWALRARSAEGDIINYNSRLLGRGGVMSANLIVDAADLASSLGAYEEILAGFTFVPGQTHAEWKAGDKIAEYVLTALIVGGGLAVAAKTGLLGKLIKPLIIFGAMAAAGIAKFWRSLTGRSDSTA